MLCLICHIVRKFVMKAEILKFNPEGHQCPAKFLLSYVTYGKNSFEIVLTPSWKLQNASFTFLSQVGYFLGVKGLKHVLLKEMFIGINVLSICTYFILTGSFQ